MTPLRAGLSGASQPLLDAVRRCRGHDQCRLLFVHDDDEARRTRFARDAGVPGSVATFDELLATGVDFVVLAGDLSRRLAQVQAAAAQGAHCLVLAPMAPDLATATAMLAACEQAGVRLGVYAPEFQDPVVDQLRRMLAADWLGGIVAVHAMLGDTAALQTSDSPPADPFLALLSRQLHLASWLIGRPVRTVTAQTTRSLRRLDDGAVATAVLGGDVPCTFAVSHATHVRAFAVHGTDGGVRLAGDRLWLLGRREFRGAVFDYLSPGPALAIARGDLAAAIAAREPQVELIGSFARWLDDCDDYPCPGESALDDLRVVEAMQLAATSGRTQHVRRPGT